MKENQKQRNEIKNEKEKKINKKKKIMAQEISSWTNTLESNKLSLTK